MDHPKQTRGWGIYYSLTVDGDYSTGERSTLHCMSTFFLFIPRLIQAIVLKNEILSCGHGSVSGTAFMRCQVAKLNPTLRLKPQKNWKTKTRRNFFLSKHKKVHTEIPKLNPLKCKFFTTGKKVITPPRRSKSPVLLFLVGYAILKDLFILVWREIHRRKFYRWRHDNWPIGQWVIFHAAPDIAYVNHYFPREFIMWFQSILEKQVDLETSSVARSLRNLMRWCSLHSLLTTYERSTCS